MWIELGFRSGRGYDCDACSVHRCGIIVVIIVVIIQYHVVIISLGNVTGV